MNKKNGTYPGTRILIDPGKKRVLEEKENSIWPSSPRVGTKKISPHIRQQQKMKRGKSLRKGLWGTGPDKNLTSTAQPKKRWQSIPVIEKRRTRTKSLTKKKKGRTDVAPVRGMGVFLRENDEFPAKTGK